MKDLSWIDEAWEESKKSDNENLIVTIEKYSDYVRDRENKRIDSERQSGQ